ncbi:unnamed protein product [Paramecium octaurelia]|uniref:Uncharacterized protein n=1 Tax=Paramecium octaurelia TaxID=43137 RepID=A0A8S1SAM6_PAROT|nr:unnamed protein product [Paramecium octaurelia]
MADVYAVQEILKISTFLYKAQASPSADVEEIHDFSLPSKLSNIKSHKILTQEITALSTRLYDQLGKEDEVKIARENALKFLSNVSREGNSQSEQSQIQKYIQTILKQQDQNIKEMSKYVGALERDQKQLDEKIKRKTKELEQAEKRLKGMTSIKPACQEEYDRQEQESEKFYQIYVEKLRNLVYLEHVLDQQIRKEELEERRKDELAKKWNIEIQGQMYIEMMGENDEYVDQQGRDSWLKSSNRKGVIMIL